MSGEDEVLVVPVDTWLLSGVEFAMDSIVDESLEVRQMRTLL